MEDQELDELYTGLESLITKLFKIESGSFLNRWVIIAEEVRGEDGFAMMSLKESPGMQIWDVDGFLREADRLNDQEENEEEE